MTTPLKATRARQLLVFLFAALLGGAISFSPRTSAQRKGRRGTTRVATPTQAKNDPAQILQLGLFYYNNDDIKDDKAAQQFKRVINDYPSAKEAREAQFFLGSYYLHKYQIRKAQGQPDTDALYNAQRAFEDYLKKYAASEPYEYLSDTYFNLAIAYLLNGNIGQSGAQLNKLKESSYKDQYVKVYQVIWSQNPKDVVDSDIDAWRLGDYASHISSLPAEKVIPMLTLWCKNEKSKK